MFLFLWGSLLVYDNKTTDASTDFVENHLTKKFAPAKIERILTDCGTEYTAWHEEAIPNHELDYPRGCQYTSLSRATIIMDYVELHDELRETPKYVGKIIKKTQK